MHHDGARKNKDRCMGMGMSHRDRTVVLVQAVVLTLVIGGIAAAGRYGVGWIRADGGPMTLEALGVGLVALPVAVAAVVLAVVAVNAGSVATSALARWVQEVSTATLATLVVQAIVIALQTALFELLNGRLYDGLDAGQILVQATGLAPTTLGIAGLVFVPMSATVAARRWLRRCVRRGPVVAAVGLAALMVGTLASAPAVALTPPAAALPPEPAPAREDAGGGVCPAGSRSITYDLAAFQLNVPLNGWGDHLPDGLVYALKNRDARVGKKDLQANPQLSQPITIRANVGDCVRIKLRNDIQGRRVGIHPDGLVQFDPLTSDGAAVGGNPDTSLGLGQERTFTWYADHEGQAPVVDIANLDSSVKGGNSSQRLLFGGVIVHPKGSTWHDPVTGANMLDENGQAVESNVFADVHVPDGQSYRSYAIMIMDETEGVLDRNNRPTTFPTTGLPDSTFGINYRSEPLRNRLRAILEHRGTRTPENPRGVAKSITLPDGHTYSPTDHFCDGFVPELGRVVEDPGAKCESEESHLQSWVFGDAGKLTTSVPGARPVVDSDTMIPKAYRGDPVRFALIHPGGKETHPWHQHTQRWFADPNNPKSPRKDVQSIGPGEAYELRFEKGAGGLQGTVGDSIFHCHFYPHFAQGFWGYLRIYDRLRDGSQSNPDGTPLQALQELPDRAGATPAPDAQHPGYPLFVKGDFGQRAYKPPNAIVKDDFSTLRRPGDTVRSPNALEAANMPGLAKDKPGAGVIDPCPADAPKRSYRPHAIDLPITYNNAGWTDRQGRLYVEESHLDAVKSGREPPQPYTVRSRQGECVQMFLTNDLHLDENPKVPIDHVNRFDDAYDLPEETSEVSIHVHLVQFDELATDGTSVGFNYVQAAMPGQTFGYRWFVDQPLRTIFFHDHQYANLHQQKGLFAAMNVEPPDAIWRDTRSGAPNDGTGPEAIIESPSGMDFREFTLFYSDRIPMWRNFGAGRPIQPPAKIGDYGADQGGYAINYRNEPFQIRTRPGQPSPQGDPAYIYSSAVHGDPATPVLRAYVGDPVVIRNVQGAHEEMHNFTLHGHRWLNEPDNPNSTLVDQQTIGLAEYFNYEIIGGHPVKMRDQGPALKDKTEIPEWNGGPAIVNKGAGGPGDFLYGSTALDDQWLGMWGIFRTSDRRQPDVAPLPDRGYPGSPYVPRPPDRGQPGSAYVPWPPAPGRKPPPARPVNTCPTSAPLRSFGVSVLAQPLMFNPTTGDNNPDGVIYTRSEDEAAVRAGLKRPQPLVLRASAGECIKITLTNKLPTLGPPRHAGDVPLPADAPFPRGNRVSLHGGMTDYDVRTSDGSTVGFNPDQTVGPGESITTYWFALPELSKATITLSDFGDRRGNAHQGLFGALAIEPPGASWTDPETGGPATGPAADVCWVENGVGQATREFVAIWQDGVRLRDRAGNPIPEAIPPNHAPGTGGDSQLDPYEQGNRGINYSDERFGPRLKENPQQAWVFSSQVHGDPATPIFRAYAGDPVTMRLVDGADRGRVHTFMVSGHQWLYQRSDPNSTIRTAVGGLLPETEATLELIGGAGGPTHRTGDFLIRDGLTVNQVNAGLWALLRVEPALRSDLRPLNTESGKHPTAEPGAPTGSGTTPPDQSTGNRTPIRARDRRRRRSHPQNRRLPRPGRANRQPGRETVGSIPGWAMMSKWTLAPGPRTG
jgi:FtsP/CotA-like multicopper oxidase with cupredoxin domain